MSEADLEASEVLNILKSRVEPQSVSTAIQAVREYDDQCTFSRQAIERIAALVGIREQEGLPNNPSVYCSELLNEVDDDHFPNAGTKELAILYLLYHREAASNELAGVANQPAAQVRDLRQKGFVFFHPDREDGVVGKGEKSTYTPEGASTPHRKIFDYDPPEAKAFLQISTSAKRRFLRDKRDPLNGTTSQLEVDHRMPISACRRAGVEPKVLTDDMVDDGSAEEHFQAISRNNNHVKREVCNACLRGEEIRIPPAFEKYKNHYKRQWKDGLGEDSCKGCFWYNPMEPEVPLPDSVTA